MSHSVVLELYRAFCRNLELERFPDMICYNHLYLLDRSLCTPQKTKAKLLNDFAGNLIDFVQNRFRSDIRKEFEDIRDTPGRDWGEVEKFGRKISVYENFFREILRDLGRFNEKHPLKPISADTMESARKGYAHFHILAALYLELLTDGLGKEREEISCATLQKRIKREKCNS